MKKILISMMLVAGIATAYAADVTTRAKITLGSSAITVRESADLSDAEDSGYDAVVYGSTNIAVIANSKKWAEWGTNDLEGVVIEFTPAATAVNFAFSNVKGDLYLVDAVANTRTKIAAATPYSFTVEASEVGTANATRFYLSKVNEKGLCFNYNKLQLTLYKGEKVEVYEPGATTPTISKDVTSDVFEIDLSDKTKGMYKVKLVNANKEYFIDVKPTVEKYVP